MSDITSEVVTITPDLAREFLTHNHGNRALSKGSVETWTKAILRGEWQLTHQGVAFDIDGNLLDGQHRLHAIAAAGIPVPMMVTRGLPRATFLAIDQGHRKQVGQLLGVPNGHLVAAISRRSMRLERPGLQSKEITARMVYDHIALYPEIHEVAVYAHQLNSNRRLTGSLIGTVLLHASVSPHGAHVKSWVEELIEGVGLSAYSPSRHLINRFSRMTSRQIGEESSLALMAKAWNAYALNQPMALLKVSSSERASIVGFTSRWELAR